MPTVFQQLAAHREISALRNVLDGTVTLAGGVGGSSKLIMLEGDRPW
ncbi:hypothetical protein [Streptomyces atratus]